MANFCTQCGKRLEQGETCNCMNRTINRTANGPAQQQAPGWHSESVLIQEPFRQEQPRQTAQTRTKEAEWLYEKKNAVVSGTKNMFAEIIPVLRAPVTKMRQISADNNSAIGIEFIVSKTVMMLIAILILLNKLSSAASGYVEIPYFKIILLTILFTAGVDFLEALLLKTLTGLGNGVTSYSAMITIVGTRALYEALIIIIAGILCVISISAGIIVFVICAFLLPYIQYSGYQAVVRHSEDKKPYIFFIGKVVMLVIVYIILNLLMSDLMLSISSGISDIMRYL